MDVIDLLCVLVGSRAVQLHDSLGSKCACTCSEGGFSSRNGDRVEELSTEEQRFVMRFLCAKGLNANDIH
jgi:hypothetical protein